MTDVNFGKLTSMHFYAWKRGLKTGMYYLRTQAAADAIKFTVDQVALRAAEEKEAAASPHGSPVKGRKSGNNSNTSTPAKSPEAKDVEKWRADRKKQAEAMMCSLDNKDECVSCGS